MDPNKPESLNPKTIPSFFTETTQNSKNKTKNQKPKTTSTKQTCLNQHLSLFYFFYKSKKPNHDPNCRTFHQARPLTILPSRSFIPACLPTVSAEDPRQHNHPTNFATRQNLGRILTSQARMASFALFYLIIPFNRSKSEVRSR
jgi:hypothetical protein